MVLSSYFEHPVHAMNAETAPLAANLWTKPTVSKSYAIHHATVVLLSWSFCFQYI